VKEIGPGVGDAVNFPPGRNCIPAQLKYMMGALPMRLHPNGLAVASYRQSRLFKERSLKRSLTGGSS
jgi:hypothetical protein